MFLFLNNIDDIQKKNSSFVVIASSSSWWSDMIAMNELQREGKKKKMMIGEKWCLFNLMEIMAFWGQNVFMSFPPAFLRLSFPSSLIKAPWINFLLFFISHDVSLWLCVFFCFYLTAFSAFKLIDFLYTIFFRFLSFCLPSTSVIFVLNEFCLFSAASFLPFVYFMCICSLACYVYPSITDVLMEKFIGIS